MPLMRIGKKPVIGPALKIMASINDDPWITANNQWEKFRFNSETMDYAYFARAGAGSGINIPAEITLYGYTPIPMFRLKTTSNGRYRYWGSYLESYYGGIAKDPSNEDFRNNYPIYGKNEWGSTFIPPEGYSMDMILTRFPAQQNYAPVSGTPVAGQTILFIDKASRKVRLAKPGYNARTDNDPDHMIFSENKAPLAICANGVTTIPASSIVNVAIPATVPVGSFVEVRPHIGANIVSLGYPGLTLNVSAWTEAGVVRFQNHNTTSVTVTWFVMPIKAPTGNGPNNKIFEVDKTGQIIRFTRPGSAASPQANDIIISDEFKYPRLALHGRSNAWAGTGGSWYDGFFNDGGANWSRLRIDYGMTFARPPLVFYAVQQGTIVCTEFGFPMWPNARAYPLSCYYTATTSYCDFVVCDTNADTYVRYYILPLPN